MDLQEQLIESRKQKRDGKKWSVSLASLVFHVMLVGGIVYAGTHQVTHKVDAEHRINAFISQGAAPPPPPPPPPPKSGGAPKATPQVKPVEIPKPMTSSVLTPPVEIPKEIPKIEMPTPTATLPVAETLPEPSSGISEGPGDAVNGVEGGVTGGVAGGIVGGEIGGTPGGEIGGVKGGVVGGQVGGTGTGTAGEGTGGPEAPVAPPPPPPPPPPVPSGPLRVGGDVKAPVTISRGEPNYTDTARKARVAGVVIVEAIIDKQGNVDNARIIKGLPMGLSEEAVKAVKRWKFRPGTLNGEPVATIFNLTVNFKLD